MANTDPSKAPKRQVMEMVAVALELAASTDAIKNMTLVQRDRIAKAWNIIAEDFPGYSHKLDEQRNSGLAHRGVSHGDFS